MQPYSLLTGRSLKALAVIDFSDEKFFQKIADIGQKYAKLNELKTMNTNRGSRHFIYLNRTFFGLYNMMHDLRAENVEINRYQKYINNNV